MVDGLSYVTIVGFALYAGCVQAIVPPARDGLLALVALPRPARGSRAEERARRRAEREPDHRDCAGERAKLESVFACRSSRRRLGAQA